MVLLFKTQPNRKLAGRITCGRAVGSGATSQYVIDVACCTNNSGNVRSCTVNAFGDGALSFSPHTVTYAGETWLALDTNTVGNAIYPSAYIFDGYAINEELKAVPRSECTDITPFQGVGSFRTNGREVYHTGNILGTVSQSGGVPTGGLMESGSNSNGEYVKLADGTMICTYTGPTNTSAQYPQIHEWSDFPVSFIGVPIIAAYGVSWRGADNNNYHYTGTRMAGRNDDTRGVRRCQVFDVTRDGGNATNATRVRWQAIGRWY